MESYLFCFTIDIHITVGNENARKLKKTNMICMLKLGQKPDVTDKHVYQSLQFSATIIFIKNNIATISQA